MSSSESEPSESELQELGSMAIYLLSLFGGSLLQDGERLTVAIDDLFGKDGNLPASKAAIAAMPVVKIRTEQGVGEGGECAICLTEYDVAGEEEVKEMPCKHRYHSGCIEKWLGIHGTCPVCRYEMPVDKDEDDEPKLVVEFVIHRSSGMDPDGAPERNELGDNMGDPIESRAMEIDAAGSSMEDID